MKVRIKKLHQDAFIPAYSKKGDAGMDLTAIERYFDLNGNVVYRTGIAVEIPEGYVGLLFPRSSVSKKDLSLCNSVGVIDSSYRGEIIVKFKPTLAYSPDDDTEYQEEKFNHWHNIVRPTWEQGLCAHLNYEVGERVAQLIVMPYPQIEFEEVEELTKTDRGDGGFGSSGK